MFRLVHTMTTLTSENEYDSSRAGQTSSSSPAPDSGYAEHQNNGRGENGYSVDPSDSQTMNSSQAGYSHGSGSGIGTSTGSKPEDERKLFVGRFHAGRTRRQHARRFDSFQVDSRGIRRKKICENTSPALATFSTAPSNTTRRLAAVAASAS